MERSEYEIKERDASPDDVEWLVDLRLATMSEYFEKSGKKLSATDQKDRVLQEFSSIRIVQLGVLDVGMMKVVRTFDVWHLVQIQVLPQYQGRGLGSLLIRD